MQARDIMTTPVITVGPRTTLGQAIATMLKSHLSGLPVIDAQRRVIGVLSEGDLLRRAELGTEVRRPRWIETFLVPGRAASAYVHTHGRFVEEVMTRDPICIDVSAPLADVVTLTEHKHVKRIPVLCADTLVGIITRADLLRALVRQWGLEKPEKSSDEQIRDAIAAAIRSENWAPGSSVSLTAQDGVVELGGVILDDRYREAMIVCAENVPGVKAVHDHLVFVELFTGAYLDPSKQDA
jgi:CBS domain-containing protein